MMTIQARQSHYLTLADLNYKRLLTEACSIMSMYARRNDPCADIRHVRTQSWLHRLPQGVEMMGMWRI